MNFIVENYSDKCEKILNNIDGKKRLLLHSCCGPCSSYVISYLTKYFDITVLYYNPNIFPYDEYLKRKEEQIKLIKEIAKVNSVDFMDCDYDNEHYNTLIKGLENEPERGNRCRVCYLMKKQQNLLKKMITIIFVLRFLLVLIKMLIGLMNLVNYSKINIMLSGYIRTLRKKMDIKTPSYYLISIIYIGKTIVGVFIINPSSFFLY